MQRKHFLGTLGTLFAGSLLPARAATEPEPERKILFPPWLKPGALIGITSPAGTIREEELKPALLQLEAWGFRARIGSSIGKKDFTLGGTDAERCADLQAMLDDPALGAILCARGGYGSVRIVDRLDFKAFRRHPKWIIGFSDITVLHSHIHRQCGVATIHSKMCNSFPDDWEKAEPIQRDTILSIRDALTGQKMRYTAPPSAANCAGTADGQLVGGNLKMLETLAGTPSDIETKGKILFVEDTGEYAYSIDRAFENLRRSGKLEKLAGLIVGGFRLKPDDPGEEFGRGVADIVLEKTTGKSYPVCFDFPVGHQRANFALRCGQRHRLTVTESGSTLTDLS
ncbi:LD-carboxypeptidase [Flaviaesturariibacter flavus]|uniref:LD-carboxypeptidase n=1 Tax=Flaviaesturariibacter flavus TaxID=2502780 RepID=A0A4R1BC53_9BACT|nr:LD-carboxypeptidase [Flaviaesturariibacter flavus]TCJ14557.1 LD-carboxypeptidase [Flaviaesturariibacter flavus]